MKDFQLEIFYYLDLVFLIDPTAVQRVLVSYFMFGRIQHQILKLQNKNTIEGLHVELNLHKSKWLVNRSYNPNKSSIGNALLALSDSLGLYSSTCAQIMILSDFNIGPEDNHIQIFCENQNLKGLIKQPTCYKILHNLTCTDLVLMNAPRSFQRTCVLET